MLPLFSWCLYFCVPNQRQKGDKCVFPKCPRPFGMRKQVALSDFTLFLTQSRSNAQGAERRVQDVEQTLCICKLQSARCKGIVCGVQSKQCMVCQVRNAYLAKCIVCGLRRHQMYTVFIEHLRCPQLAFGFIELLLNQVGPCKFPKIIERGHVGLGNGAPGNLRVTNTPQCGRNCCNRTYRSNWIGRCCCHMATKSQDCFARNHPSKTLVHPLFMGSKRCHNGFWVVGALEVGSSKLTLPTGTLSKHPK